MCQAVRNTSGTLAAWLKSRAVGNGNHIDCGDGNQFAIAAVDAIAQHGKLAALILQSGDALRTVIAEMHGREQHTLPRFEASDVLADFDDLARNIAAQNVRQLHAGQSLAHPDIEMVHSASFDPDQNLVLARLRIGDIFVAENFRTTEFVHANGFQNNLLRTLETTTRLALMRTPRLSSGDSASLRFNGLDAGTEA